MRGFDMDASRNTKTNEPRSNTVFSYLTNIFRTIISETRRSIDSLRQDLSEKKLYFGVNSEILKLANCSLIGQEVFQHNSQVVNNNYLDSFIGCRETTLFSACKSESAFDSTSSRTLPAWSYGFCESFCLARHTRNLDNFNLSCRLLNNSVEQFGCLELGKNSFQSQIACENRLRTIFRNTGWTNRNHKLPVYPDADGQVVHGDIVSRISAFLAIEAMENSVLMGISQGRWQYVMNRRGLSYYQNTGKNMSHVSRQEPKSRICGRTSKVHSDKEANILTGHSREKMNGMLAEQGSEISDSCSCEPVVMESVSLYGIDASQSYPLGIQLVPLDPSKSVMNGFCCAGTLFKDGSQSLPCHREDICDSEILHYATEDICSSEILHCPTENICAFSQADKCDSKPDNFFEQQMDDMVSSFECLALQDQEDESLCLTVENSDRANTGSVNDESFLIQIVSDKVRKRDDNSASSPVLNDMIQTKEDENDQSLNENFECNFATDDEDSEDETMDHLDDNDDDDVDDDDASDDVVGSADEGDEEADDTTDEDEDADDSSLSDDDICDGSDSDSDGSDNSDYSDSDDGLSNNKTSDDHKDKLKNKITFAESDENNKPPAASPQKSSFFISPSELSSDASSDDESDDDDLELDGGCSWDDLDQDNDDLESFAFNGMYFPTSVSPSRGILGLEELPMLSPSKTLPQLEHCEFNFNCTDDVDDGSHDIVFSHGADDQVGTPDDEEELPAPCRLPRLGSVNARWSSFYGSQDSESGTTRKTTENRPKMVHFAKESILVTLHVEEASQAEDYAAARKGPWEEYARDRDRFARKIQSIGDQISWIFHPSHRDKIFRIVSCA